MVLWRNELEEIEILIKSHTIWIINSLIFREDSINLILLFWWILGWFILRGRRLFWLGRCNRYNRNEYRYIIFILLNRCYDRYLSYSDRFKRSCTWRGWWVCLTFCWNNSSTRNFCWGIWSRNWRGLAFFLSCCRWWLIIYMIIVCYCLDCGNRSLWRS